MSTNPGPFPPEPTMPIGTFSSGSKLGNTAAFGSTRLFTAPVTGWYNLSWGVHIEQTDGAGTITLTVTPPHNVAIPGVDADPTGPADGAGAGAPYFFNAGESVTVSCAVGSLTGTTFDVWVFAQRVA